MEDNAWAEKAHTLLLSSGKTLSPKEPVLPAKHEGAK